MKRLLAMATRIAFWAIFGAGMGYALTAIYMIAFQGGKFSVYFNSGEAMGSASIGAVIGGVIGFFKRL